MCVTSMVTDHYMLQYPTPLSFPAFKWPDYQELIRKARLYDEMMKQPDCPSPVKDQWAQELERIMREKYGLVPTTQK